MTGFNFEQMRQAMVASQLRTTAVNDPAVVAAMATVPREKFVPEANAPLAYIDRSIRVGQGRALNPPMTTGLLLTESHPRTGERALVIGAATGYACALLVQMGVVVIGLEEDARLLKMARATSSSDVDFVEGPLAKGWRKGAPYDLILIDGAIEHVPQIVIDQLAEAGRLATAILDRGVTRLAVGRRAGSGFGLMAFADAEAVALPGFEEPRGFTF